MKSLIKKIFAALLLIVITGNFQFASAASLSELQKQKDAAAAAAAAAQKAADQKAAEASAIKSQINEITSQINETQQALDDTNTKIAEAESNITALTQQITQQQDQLNKEQDKMSKVLVAWYMEGDSSGLFNAMINANSLSEAITKEEYYDAIRQQIELAMEKINKIKADLNQKKDDETNKKAELVKMKQEQESYRSLVVSRKSQKDSLLSATVAQKQSYLAQVDKLQSDIHKISDAIYSERQKLAKSSNEKYLGGTSSYPFSSIDEPDPWMFLTRECTSYVAWYWNVKLGKEFINTRPGSGSAWNWPALARDQGYSVSSSPRVGAIITWQQTGSMPYGHVAIVEAVNSNGTIDLSEYNWVKYSYSYRGNVDPDYYGAHSYIY